MFSKLQRLFNQGFFKYKRRDQRTRNIPDTWKRKQKISIENQIYFKKKNVGIILFFKITLHKIRISNNLYTSTIIRTLIDNNYQNSIFII